ncbi:MAG: PAS domain S-box protein [Magnetococcales bacterium]|nr:PAS domain S-box protein [Magnetococcales bacterium]
MKTLRALHFPSSSITTRFIVTFSLLFAAVFSASTWIFMNGLPGSTFLGWAGNEKDQALHTINILVDIQKNRLLHGLEEWRRAAGFLAQDWQMKLLLEALLIEQSDHGPSSPSSLLVTTADRYLEAALKDIQTRDPACQAIHVIAMPSGNKQLSTRTAPSEPMLVDRDLIDRIRTSGSDYIGGFSPPMMPQIFFVGSPVFIAKKNPEAMVVLEISLQKFLQPLLIQPKGPWRSLETILVNERGINLLQPGEGPLNSRYHWNSADDVTLPPWKMAVQGQEGLIETRDIHRTPLLAGYRHIRPFSEWYWGLVVQIGRDDLMKPMSTAFGIAWVMGMVATGVFMLVAWILARRLIRPLRQLTEAAQQLTTGQRHVRSHYRGEDEVGILARAFDTMADEVARTLDHLERSVVQRTVALELELELRKQQQREQQLMELSLKESEQRYRSLVDTMVSGVIVYEAVAEGNDFIIRDINRMGERLGHVRKQEIIGRSVAAVFPGIVEFGLFPVLRKVYRTGIPANLPMTLYRDHRFHGWFENQVYQLPSGEIVAVFEDVTERKLAEDALQMAQFSIDHSHDAIVWFAENGRILRSNQAASVLLGYDREKLLNLSASDIFPEMTLLAWEQSWRRIRQTGTQVHETQWCTQEGACIPVEVSATYLPGAADRDDSIFASVRDITERNRAEKEKRALEQMAFHRERLATIGTLAAGVAHEINNPNNAIHFNTVMLQELWPDLRVVLAQTMEQDGDFLLAGLPASESMKTIPRMLEGIRKSSERIQRIIGNLKHLSRQDQELASRPIELQGVIREAVAILQTPISRHTDHFHLEYPEDSIMVHGNSQQLEQVFINLIFNALQSLPTRHHGVDVTTTMPANGKEVEVAITDEGIGIPENNLPKLTDPFFTTKAEQEGTGLGLSIANTIIENHGGRLTFVSREGIGTTVTVILPIVSLP